MMNKKLIALLVAISTVSAISAECYTGDDGYRHCDDGRAVVREPITAAEKTTNAVFGIFGDHERSEDARNRRRDNRERDRERDRYYDYR